MMAKLAVICVLLCAFITAQCKHQQQEHQSGHQQHQEHQSGHQQHQSGHQEHQEHHSGHHHHHHHHQKHHGGLQKDLQHIMEKLDAVEKRLKKVEHEITCPQQQQQQEKMLNDQALPQLHVCEGIAATLDGYLQKLTGELDEKLRGVSTRPHHQAAAAFSAADNKCVLQPRNCADVHDGGNADSGVYTVYIPPSMTALKVYCDMDEAGGWTVIQKRFDGSVNFTRDWDDYSAGFGGVDGEYWLGNSFLHLLTGSTAYKLKVDLEDFDGQTATAEYSSFQVESEEHDYRLTLGDYWGSAGDSLNGRRGYLKSDGMRFSTYDRDNDKSTHNLAEKYGGGWWYNQHTFSTVNGRYVATADYRRDMQAIIWSTWRGYHGIKAVQMKIKPEMCPCT